MYSLLVAARDTAGTAAADAVLQFRRKHTIAKRAQTTRASGALLLEKRSRGGMGSTKQDACSKLPRGVRGTPRAKKRDSKCWRAVSDRESGQNLARIDLSPEKSALRSQSGGVNSTEPSSVDTCGAVPVEWTPRFPCPRTSPSKLTASASSSRLAVRRGVIRLSI